MSGGTVIRVVGEYAEVLDKEYVNRQWRRCKETTDIQVDDQLWWQSDIGYLGRRAEFADRNIGSCRPSDPPNPEA